MEVSGPLSPKKIGEYYFSAPTSPSHLSQFYNKGSDDLFAAGNDTGGGLSSTVPFDWEEKPGTPKSSVRTTNNDDDFAFDVIRNYETAPLSAEELFDGGLIKSLKPPPRLHLPLAARNSENVTTLSPRKSSVSQTRKIIQGALFSPRHKNTKETDPFALAEKTAAAQRGPSSRRAARSLSPIRDRRFSWGVKEDEGEKGNSSPSHTVCSTLSLSAAPVKGYKKWRLKDFFLFRSASEGRAADKDPLKKYTAALRGTSFGATEGSGSGTGSRRRGPVSAHELHYTVNRAVSEDLKKKTFLPYKQGILGRLAFNPAVSSPANGFGFSRK